MKISQYFFLYHDRTLCVSSNAYQMAILFGPQLVYCSQTHLFFPEINLKFNHERICKYKKLHIFPFHLN